MQSNYHRQFSSTRAYLCIFLFQIRFSCEFHRLTFLTGKDNKNRFFLDPTIRTDKKLTTISCVCYFSTAIALIGVNDILCQK